MRPFLTLVYSYYNSPLMLTTHYNHWAGFSTDTKTLFEVVIVDDGSRVAPAADVARPEGLPPLQIWRIHEDKFFNWPGARNLGAHVTRTPWVLTTDIDHMLPEETIQSIARNHTSGEVYRFARLDYPSLQPTLGKRGEPKPHPNTYCMETALYNSKLQHDEFFSGHYGFDGLYRTRVDQCAKVVLRPDPIWRVPREAVADASTDHKALKAARPPNYHRMMKQKKAESPSAGKILTFQFTYERVL
jgi:hypothetical protein